MPTSSQSRILFYLDDFGEVSDDRRNASVIQAVTDINSLDLANTMTEIMAETSHRTNGYPLLKSETRLSNMQQDGNLVINTSIKPIGKINLFTAPIKTRSIQKASAHLPKRQQVPQNNIQISRKQGLSLAETLTIRSFDKESLLELERSRRPYSPSRVRPLGHVPANDYNIQILPTHFIEKHGHQRILKRRNSEPNMSVINEMAKLLSVRNHGDLQRTMENYNLHTNTKPFKESPGTMQNYNILTNIDQFKGSPAYFRPSTDVPSTDVGISASAGLNDRKRALRLLDLGFRETGVKYKSYIRPGLTKPRRKANLPLSPGSNNYSQCSLADLVDQGGHSEDVAPVYLHKNPERTAFSKKLHNAKGTTSKNSKKREKKRKKPKVETVRLFSKPPKPHPNIVCFDHQGVWLTHKDVRHILTESFPDLEHLHITSIAFEAMNTILGTNCEDNRWLISVSDINTLSMLVSSVIHIAGVPVTLRKYDDVLKEEYAKFLHWKALHGSPLLAVEHEQDI